MKEKKKGVCQDCLNTFTYNQLYSVHIISQVGPEHAIGLCKKCAHDRGISYSELDTMQEVLKRMNKYLGLKS